MGGSVFPPTHVREPVAEEHQAPSLGAMGRSRPPRQFGFGEGSSKQPVPERKGDVEVSLLHPCWIVVSGVVPPKRTHQRPATQPRLPTQVMDEVEPLVDEVVGQHAGEEEPGQVRRDDAAEKEWNREIHEHQDGERERWKQDVEELARIPEGHVVGSVEDMVLACVALV